MTTPLEAARAAFPTVTHVCLDGTTGEYEAHVTFDAAIHLDTNDTYLGSVWLEGGQWMAVARLTPFVPSSTDDPPANYEGCGAPFPIGVNR